MRKANQESAFARLLVLCMILRCEGHDRRGNSSSRDQGSTVLWVETSPRRPAPAWVAVLWTKASKSGGSNTVNSPADAAKSIGFLTGYKMTITKKREKRSPHLKQTQSARTTGNRMMCFVSPTAIAFHVTRMGSQTSKSCNFQGCLPRCPAHTTCQALKKSCGWKFS